jgi:hypothetical protein
MEKKFPMLVEHGSTLPCQIFKKQKQNCSLMVDDREQGNFETIGSHLRYHRIQK